MADPYKFSFDVAAFLEEQEVADTSVAPKEGVMKKPEAPVEEAPMSNTDRLKKRFADTVSSFYSSAQEIRDKYNTAQETNPLLGRDAAQNEWMTALSVPAVTTTALGPDMDTMAMQDAQEQAAIRSASGITESLGRPAPAGLGDAPVQPETPVIYEEGATITNGKDSPVGSPTSAGLMSPPAQGGVSEIDTSTGAPNIPEGYASSMFSGKGNNTKPVMQKVKDFADKTYSNPITAAAFSAIVEAESGTALVEDGYKKKRAIEVFVDRNRRKDGTLGPKMAARKAAIEALPEGYSGDDIFDIVYGGRMGNTEPGDGSKYKGRGLIMITGKNRYKALGDTIGVDLVKNPELLETDKDVMLRATLAYLEDKSFSTSSLSQSKLASIIGHSDDSNGTEAKKRWKRTKEIYKEMTGEDMPSRPSTIRKFAEDQSLQESLRPVLRPERSE